MNIREAHDVLKQHQEWRTDIEDEFNHPATDSKLLTEALSVAIGVLSRMTCQDEPIV